MLRPGALGDLHRGGAGELVRLAGYEGLEGEGRVQPRHFAAAGSGRGPSRCRSGRRGALHRFLVREEQPDFDRALEMGSAASSSTRRANLSRIHCCTKRLGAISVTESASTLHFSGLIQVRNCWGGSSFSNEARQRRQKGFIGTVLELEFGPRHAQRDDSKFYLFRGWLSTGWSVFPNAFHACEAAALRAPARSRNWRRELTFVVGRGCNTALFHSWQW